jgi:hypothetical protein
MQKFRIQMIGISIIVVILLLNVYINVIIPSIKYNNAQSLYNEGAYREALELYIELGAYKDSKTKVIEINDIITQQNWVEYKGMTLQLPSDLKSKVKIVGEEIHINDEFELSINKFLECLKAPEGKSFYAASNYAAVNGTKSFVIKNKLRGQGQYYSNQSYDEWTTEYFNLLFYGDSSLKAIYVNQSDRVPLYIHGMPNSQTLTISLQNGQHEAYFRKGTTIIVGQYYDSTTKQNPFTFTIVVVCD